MKKIYLIPALAMISFGCRNSSDNTQEAKPITTDTTISSSCPFLAKDNKGGLAMSWIKELNDTDAILCYSVLDKEGDRFTQTYEIPASKGVHPHGENLPKVVCKPDGTLIAMWGLPNPSPKNKYSGLVSYAVSKNGGKDWSEAIPLVSDTSSYDQRYFDMEVLPSGEVAALWLDSRFKKGKEGSTLFYAVADANNRFVGEHPIAESCCPCCRTDLFVDSKGNIHAAFRDIIEDSIRDMVHIVSIDQGKTFLSPERISVDNWAIEGCPHTGPTMAENKNGLHFAWYTMGTGSGVFYNHLTGGKTFSAKENVSSLPTAKHPQILATSANDLLIAWDQVVKSGDAANNMVLVQRRSPDGKMVSTDSITTAADVAYFPVLREYKERSVMMAFTVQKGKKSQVYYKKYLLK
ncbi:hypothetical protein [Polluticoccus soli]|uniref:hypothetical protein n=1 Tax=Polluticoccus soli TaxID=3034150 RepID=UPI0023E0D7A0|nr:hypothetical protein [Flavipsychrobacter sp. JY13-12]